ncbi:MAG: ABC transporter substrate-binding protein [Coriobacteriia bacterium]|nr:ABC transporter substrate-binding protein [Coriobacteriia bacterium]
MKSKHLLSALILALLLSVLSLSACGEPSLAESQKSLTPTVTSPTIGQEGVLRVGVNYQNAPFSVNVTDSIEGIDVDIARAIAETLGLQVEFVDIGENGAADEIEAGAVDVAMGGTSEQSVGDLVAVGRYIENAPGLFTITTNGEPVVATAQDVNNAIVGVQENSETQQLIQKLFPSAQIVTFSTVNDAFAALVQNQVKYVASDSYSGAYLAQMQENVSYAGSLDIPSSTGLLMSANNSQLASSIQQALDTISSNGVLALIRSKWVGNLPQLNEGTQILTVEQKAQATTDSIGLESTSAVVPEDITSLLTSGSPADATSEEDSLAVGGNAMVPNENGVLEPVQENSENNEEKPENNN